MNSTRPERRHGFTLTELLVVIAILLLISAAVIPVALGALGDQEMSESASTVQAAFSLTRDAAVREGRPTGLRLVPDSVLGDPYSRLASNRLREMHTPPDYSEGFVIPVVEEYTALGVRRLAFYEAKNDGASSLIPGIPTSWYFNIRQGEIIRIEGGQSFTIVGPMTVGPNFGNPERFVNETENLQRNGTAVTSLPVTPTFEKLFVLNRKDDPAPAGWLGAGYIDEVFDGVDNNGDFLVDPPSGIVKFIDPGFNGIDDDDDVDPTRADQPVDDPKELALSRNIATGTLVYNPAVAEYETEFADPRLFQYVRIFPDPGGFPDPPLRLRTNPATVVSPLAAERLRYSIKRRPLPSPSGRDITLPSDVVIDLTTSIATGNFRERSRVPVDPATGFVDFLIYPNGQIVPSSPFGNFTSLNDYPFYFLWLAERQDVYEPQPISSPPPPFVDQVQLPVPRNTANYTQSRYLEGQRRMVVISPNSGHAAVGPIEFFDGGSRDAPFGASIANQQSGGPAPL